ncbi:MULTISPECIES: hypothetical protein [unclassified Ensifer]|uniref:hypothetical protein n=1 Tax=unclassified Ensifer TaxID=2633371 RepID=UPI0008135D95|nr:MULTISPECIES: hypothetical protein [unclassified Ensifer]OCO99219.1 hypothetical protein BBX50_09905 [Ensifer sp. LC11]OCO99427.1 hypothetical protein BC374_09970 [Ensifer sp. LC13]OCP14423.1 hypothetical protein BC362_03930 [Ensifer sp. LC14]OCP29535.1 hypothetical protein BC364_07705 [Ensifer sp. LC499]
MRSERHLSRIVIASGATLFFVGLGWWWLVFRQVMAGDYLTLPQAALCLAQTSDICALAQALCKTEHVLGITRYSTELFWTSATLLTLGLTLEIRSRLRTAATHERRLS